MNKYVRASQLGNGATGWDRPEPSSEFLAKHPAIDIEAWRQLRERTIEAAIRYGWRKVEVARRSSMPESTFSQWMSGTLMGVLANQNRVISQWLDAVDDMAGMASQIATSPTFTRTSVAEDIISMLTWAQMTAGFVMATLPAGSGKTTACRHYCNSRPHAYLATISPHTKTVHGMLVELSAELGVQENNPARYVRAIGSKLQRIGDGSLLIIDEAQNLTPEAVNQLRHFVDVHQCGVALIGNDEIAARFAKEVKASSSRDQVTSRFDRRLKKVRDPAGDARKFIEGWGVTDADAVKFLEALAARGGALRQIDRTLKLANTLLEPEEKIELKHIKAAWMSRDVGDIA